MGILNLQNLLEVKQTAYVMGSSTVAKYLSEVVLEFVSIAIYSQPTTY